MDRATNVATFGMAPGYCMYLHFCKEAGTNNNNDHPMTIDATMVSDDKDDEKSHQIPIFKPEVKIPSQSEQVDNTETMNLDLETSPSENPVIIEDNDENKQPSSTSTEFLKYHLKFNHCPPKKI